MIAYNKLKGVESSLNDWLNKDAGNNYSAWIKQNPNVFNSNKYDTFWDKYYNFLSERKKDFLEVVNSKLPTFEASNKQASEIKPRFKTDAIPTIFDIIKQHFPNRETDLKTVLETGNLPDPKLLFHGNGKTLLDFFKQLITGQFLSVVVQKDFETWLSNGFEYLHKGKQKAITPKYASKIISGDERAAKGNRLIDVVNKNGKFEINQLEIKNREKTVK